MKLMVTRMSESERRVSRTMTIDGCFDQAGSGVPFAAVSDRAEPVRPIVSRTARIPRAPGTTAVHGLISAYVHSGRCRVDRALTRIGQGLPRPMIDDAMTGPRAAGRPVTRCTQQCGDRKIIHVAVRALPCPSDYGKEWPTVRTDP
ncbi:hypothetical protein Ahu01nite_068930 [Winogradskya humida]|uniref:Transposase n=1 Tax=Winogradskya humida TaxID=113566 RepID=A0ABQ3ZYY1_9ACTN|nr:hypothetical protein Ahu01nite_068930 [Actinoplanes humidus]